MTHAARTSWDVPVHAKVEVSYADPGGTAVWVDETAYLDSLSISRGRPTELGRTEPGNAVVVFDNLDGHFDPTNVSSPHYPDVVPVRRIRAYAVVDTGRSAFSVRSSSLRSQDVFRSEVYEIPMFDGLVEQWEQSWPNDGRGAAVACHAVDGLSVVAAAQYTAASIPAELSGTRIGRVLDAISWPAGDRVLDAGAVQVVVGTNVSSNALTHLQDVVASEGGFLFADTSGKVAFLDSDHQIAIDGANVWGDATGEKGYDGLSVVYDDAQLWNDIRVKTAGDTDATASDATSIARYFRRSLVVDSLINVDADRSSRATDLLAAYKDPRLRLVEISPSPDDDEEWVRVFQTELADGIRVRRRPPGGGLIEQDSRVEGINIQFVETGIQRVVWRLSGVSPATITRVFYPGASSADLSGGSDFNLYLDPETSAAGILYVTVAASSTETSYGFTRSGDVPTGITAVGNYTVRVGIKDSSADELLTLDVRVRRVNNSGTVQASSSVTSQPQDVAREGVRTFLLPSVDLGTWSAGDRLRVDYIFVNASGGAQTTGILAGSTDCEVITPLV